MMKRWLLLLFCVLAAVPQGFAAPVVLFDEGHGQPFHVRGDGALDLSGLAERFAANGLEVRTTTDPLDDERLHSTTALVISGAFRPLSPAELAAVQAFLNGGGQLVVMLHIAPPLGEVLDLLKVDYANGILHDATLAIDGNPQYILVNRMGSHPVTEGLPAFAVYGCWALRGTAPPVEPVAWTSVQGWVDLVPDAQLGAGDARGPFAVAVAGHSGAGSYLVFGDDALFQNRFLAGNNRLLADNLARWLVRGNSPRQMELELHK